MVAHRKRQHEPLPTPSAFGISNAITALDGGPTATSLAFDDSVSANQRGPGTAPPLAISTDPTITVPTPSLPTSSPLPSTTAPTTASGATSSISISTVVGSCVGAFIGATALIGLALWFYKRYLGSLKKRAHTPRTISHSRNRTADVERRRSHLEPWNKLNDTDDKWEGQYHTKEIENVGPMEKLTMFKKTPSVRTAWTQEAPVFDPQSFAQYHPSIAESIASKKGESVRDDEALLVMPRHNGAMSPSLQMAIPTPPAMQSVLQMHHWESAEVLQYDPNPPPVEKQSSEEPAQNPFEDEPVERRKSLSNPFFGAQGRSSIHGSTRSRSNSKSTISPKLKGKERAIDPEPQSEHAENPFNDPQPQLPTTTATKHTPSDSESSNSSDSQERALQSLIAALNIPETEVQERLRVASMQPSVYSETSVYTTTVEDEDFTMTGSFPLPPSTPTKGASSAGAQAR